MIIDEPVRGSVPPAWFPALPGIERIRALSNGLLPLPPLFRLLGIRPAHVGLGAGTWTMPPSGWLNGGFGGLEISAFVETVLVGVATTVLPAGVEVDPISLSINYFRPTRAQHGNLVARGRVVNTSSFFAFAEVMIEDPQGRQLAHAASQLAIRSLERPPPPPPSELRPIEEPTYTTADPCLRPMPTSAPTTEAFGQDDGLTVVRTMISQPSLHQELHGHQLVQVDEGRIVGTLPASEWFCRFSRHVAPGIVASIAQQQRSLATVSWRRPGDAFAGLEQHMRFYRPVPANGQLLRVEAEARRAGRDGGDLNEATATIHDADGAVVARGHTITAYIDSSKRQRRSKPEAKRTLTTLLFTDIVDSTEHAERLRDARWRALLEEYRVLVRSEIERCEGIEVDTAGDGFFARFESPARALECARATREAVTRLGIEIRAGIHTGECEVQGRNLTGMAVHIAARVQAAATPGEILATETVKAIAMGSGIRFEDRGEHPLKGVPGEWRLYAVVG